MINPPSDLAILVPWVISHGYLIFLIAATVEGPLTTIAAGVAAALGFFNIYFILALAFLGDIGGDTLYYAIGYFSHNLIRSPFFRFFGLSNKLIEKVEKLVYNHTSRAVLLIKISPVIGPIGLIILGAARPPFKKFLKPALGISIPKSLFFTMLGYYSGQTYLELNKVIANGQEIAIGIIVIILVIYLAYIKIMSVITKRIAK